VITKDKIEDIVNDKIADSDVFVVSISVGSGNNIKINLDSDSGLGIDECVQISRHVEHTLDRDEEDFKLDVSSPGVDEGLTMPRQYKKHVGRTLRVLREGEIKKVEGELAEVGSDQIKLVQKEKKRVEGRKKKEWVTTEYDIPFNEIEEAKVIVSFK
jgi:ribosome maturation factor RimP